MNYLEKLKRNLIIEGNRAMTRGPSIIMPLVILVMIAIAILQECQIEVLHNEGARLALSVAVRPSYAVPCKAVPVTASRRTDPYHLVGLHGTSPDGSAWRIGWTDAPAGKKVRVHAANP